MPLFFVAMSARLGSRRSLQGFLVFQTSPRDLEPIHVDPLLCVIKAHAFFKVWFSEGEVGEEFPVFNPCFFFFYLRQWCDHVAPRCSLFFGVPSPVSPMRRTMFMSSPSFQVFLMFFFLLPLLQVSLSSAAFRPAAFCPLFPSAAREGGISYVSYPAFSFLAYISFLSFSFSWLSPCLKQPPVALGTPFFCFRSFFLFCFWHTLLGLLSCYGRRCPVFGLVFRAIPFALALLLLGSKVSGQDAVPFLCKY